MLGATVGLCLHCPQWLLHSLGQNSVHPFNKKKNYYSTAFEVQLGYSVMPTVYGLQLPARTSREGRVAGHGANKFICVISDLYQGVWSVIPRSLAMNVYGHYPLHVKMHVCCCCRLLAPTARGGGGHSEMHCLAKPFHGHLNISSWVAAQAAAIV